MNSPQFLTEEQALTDMSMAQREVIFFMSSEAIGILFGAGQRKVLFRAQNPKSLVKTILIESRGVSFSTLKLGAYT